MYDRASTQWNLHFNDGSDYSFDFGHPGDLPIMGDWDCNGTETVGMYQSSSGLVQLRNSNEPGKPDLAFFYGQSGDMPLVGDWNGDGCDTLAVYRPTRNSVFISNQLGTRPADFFFYFGVPGDKLLAGDFDGDGVDDIAARRTSEGTIYLRYSLSTGVADSQVQIGSEADRFVAADWDGDGVDTLSFFRPSDQGFYVEDQGLSGGEDFVIRFGDPAWIPVSGGSVQETLRFDLADSPPTDVEAPASTTTSTSPPGASTTATQPAPPSTTVPTGTTTTAPPAATTTTTPTTATVPQVTTTTSLTTTTAPPPPPVPSGERIVFEGFGAASVGGRGGDVIEVTNLNDSGSGSLREAVETNRPRTIVFRVGGVIELNSKLHLQNPFITIAGQTAPGDGITITNGASGENALVITTHDVIISNLSIRPGPGGQPDGITIAGSQAHDIVIDHVSVSWAVDENIDIWGGASDVTVQWSIISEGLNCSTHPKGCHSKGMLIGDTGTGPATIHHNLFVHNGERAPRLSGSGVFDIVNNVIYNSGQSWVSSSDGNPVKVNYVGNLMLPSPSNTPNKWAAASDDVLHQIYLDGNEAPVEAFDPNEWHLVVTDRHAAPRVSTTSAQRALDDVLRHAGASLGLTCDGTLYLRRDAIDRRIVDNAQRGQGGLIDDPSQVGGLPSHDPGTPCADTDHDGLPDEWESAHNLDPNSSGDANAPSGSGMTYLEVFLTGGRL